LTASQTDKAGNVGPDCGPVKVIVKTTPPTDPVVDQSNGSEVTGSSDPDTIITVTDKNGRPVPGCENVIPDPDTGRFACRPTTPLAPGDEITVTATDKAGNPSKPVVITVTALRIEIVSPVVRHGDTQTVIGYNFNPGEQVSLSFYPDQHAGYATANADGIVAFEFTVPQHLGASTHTAVLTGAQSGPVSGTFTVTGPEVHTGGLSAPSNTNGIASGALCLLVFAGCCMVLLRRQASHLKAISE